jgi:hypothetical protein
MAPSEASYLFKATLLEKWMDHLARRDQRARRRVYNEPTMNTSALFLIKETCSPISGLMITPGSALDELTHVSDKFIQDTQVFGQCYLPAVKYYLFLMIRDVSYSSKEHRSILYQLISFATMFRLCAKSMITCLILILDPVCLAHPNTLQRQCLKKHVIYLQLYKGQTLAS